MKSTMRHVVLIGGPGVGKGTFASLLCQQMGWKHMSLGDEMRKQVAQGTPLGSQIGSLMTSGKLIPDALACELAFKTLGALESEEVDASTRIPRWPVVFLDGFPRTVAQAESLIKREKETKTPPCLAVHVVLDREIAVQKLLARRVCSQCGRGFNTAHIVTTKDSSSTLPAGYDMPAILPDPLTCPLGPDKCKPLLTKRSDDTEKTIRARFDEFERKTEPVLDFFKQRKLLREFVVRCVFLATVSSPFFLRIELVDERNNLSSPLTFLSPSPNTHKNRKGVKDTPLLKNLIMGGKGLNLC